MTDLPHVIAETPLLLSEELPDRLAAVMAYCATHPYDGPEPDVQSLYVESRYDYDTDTRTAWTRDTVPEFIDIAAFFLEDDDSIVRFEDDAVVFPVQPRTLRYRPLYARLTSRTIVLQRIDEEDNELAEPNKPRSSPPPC